ncbi:MAG: hypothetical protein AABY22_19100 [Nanoarchaeota archaeon]
MSYNPGTDILQNHRGYWIYTNPKWVEKWLDTNKKLISQNERPCKLCGKFNIEEGEKSYDPCLGKLPGVKFACCGHGLTNGYIVFENDIKVKLVRLRKKERNEKT